MTRAVAGVPATATSVSRSAAWARRAAPTGVHGGHKRVFTRPATGDFAITKIVARERTVAVHEANNVVGGRDEAREACGAEPPAGLENHLRTDFPRDVGRAVGRTVVDDDRRVSAGKPRDNARQRGRLVERGKN